MHRRTTIRESPAKCRPPRCGCGLPPLSWQAPGSHRFAKLFERGQVSGDGLAPGQLRGAIASFGVQEIEQAGGAAPVRVFADLAVLLRHFQIADRKSTRLNSSHLVISYA